MRASASFKAVESSLLSAFNLSGRFITRTAMPSCLFSRMTGPEGAVCAALLIRFLRTNWLSLGFAFLGIALFFRFRNDLRELAKVLQLFAFSLRILSAGGRQHVDARAVKMFLLKAELAFALGKLFVDDLSVEGNDVGRELLELLRKNDAAFGEISARQLFHSFGGPLDQ